MLATVVAAGTGLAVPVEAAAAPPQSPAPDATVLSWGLPGFTGCSEWWEPSESGRWEFLCDWLVDDPIDFFAVRAFYYWNADTESTVLYRYIIENGWNVIDCYVGYMCDA